MKTENVVVEQRALRCVEVIRTLTLEVSEGFRDPHWLRRIAEQGDKDLGPFEYSTVVGTEYLEPLSTRVLGVTEDPADVPLVDEEKS